MYVPLSRLYLGVFSLPSQLCIVATSSTLTTVSCCISFSHCCNFQVIPGLPYYRCTCHSRGYNLFASSIHPQCYTSLQSVVGPIRWAHKSCSIWPSLTGCGQATHTGPLPTRPHLTCRLWQYIPLTGPTRARTLFAGPTVGYHGRRN